MAHRWGIGTPDRALAAALALGATVLSLAAGATPANAQTSGGREIHCMIVNRWGTTLIYRPGGVYVDENGPRAVCDQDGKWYPYGSHLDDSSGLPGSGGGVNAP